MKNVTPNIQASDAASKPKLLDQLKRCIRDKYYSLRTEEAYVYWARWSVFADLQGVHALMAKLMYGTGMRLMECMTLRVKDVDFERREITIRNGKGGKDRMTMLPLSLAVPLREQIALARVTYDATTVSFRQSIARDRLH